MMPGHPFTIMAHAMWIRSTIDVMPLTSVLASRSSGPCSYSVRGSEAERRHLNEDDDGSDVSG